MPSADSHAASAVLDYKRPSLHGPSPTSYQQKSCLTRVLWLKFSRRLLRSSWTY